MMMKKTLAGLVLAVVSLSMSGCAKYYMVESSYVVSDLKEQPSQVTRSSRAPDLSMLRTVAVKAPDLCINESQSQKTGESKGNAQVMKVQCGVEMAQIESALARAGFAVISWKILDNAMTVADAKTTTHLDAAKSLGADVLMQINSMERAQSNAGSNARWDRRYKKANASGDIKGNAAVSVNISNQLNALVSGLERNNRPPARLSANVNANAVDVSSGQAFWFYDWNNVEAAEQKERNVSILARCKGELCFPASQRQSRLQQLMKKEELVSGNSQAITNTARAEDQVRARHEALIEEVINDMVKNFAAM
tara:strand:+ start:1245 stop:2171 length:927 start_codon:yes stop_codon:yes gene_type:complete